MKLKIGTIIIISVMCLSLISVSPANTHGPVMVDDTYNLYVVMDQWNMKIYDLNYVDQLVDSGMNNSEAMEKAKYTETIGSFDKGKTVNITAVSRDVQHGFAIDEVNVSVALNRPTPGEEFGDPSNITFETPQEDMTMTAYCSIFCGIGHDDESHMIDFIVGTPTQSLNLDLGITGVLVVSLSSLAILSRKVLKIQ